MKKQLFIVLAVLVVGIGGASLYASNYNDGVEASSEADTVESTFIVEVDDKSSEQDSEAVLEESFNAIPTKTAEDGIDNGNVLYYFYQPTCSHCLEIKPDVVDYYQNKSEDIKFYAVDLTQDVNQGLWSNDKSNEVGDNIKLVSEFKVQGTPTMVQTNDGEVTAVAVGTDQVLELLKSN